MKDNKKHRVSHDSNSPIGLIAGSGRFPIQVAENIKKDNNKLLVIAIEGETEPEISQLADIYYTFSVGQVRKIRRALQREMVSMVMFAGGIKRVNLFSLLKIDFEGIRLLAKIGKFTDDALLRGVASHLEGYGIEVISATNFLFESIAPTGVLTKIKLTEQQKAWAKFAWAAAKEIGKYDIGQTVVVNRGVIVSVEGVEGTDHAIERGGALSGSGAIAVKVCKPNQDQRMDLPTIGIKTIELLIKIGAKGLIVEGGKSLILDPLEVVKLADANNIVIEGW